MLVSDVLVTDYSSAIFEFSLLDRPMVFFAPDYEAYERERGFYFDYRTGVPGPIFETTAELAAYLRAGIFDTRPGGTLPRRVVRRRRWTFRNLRHGRAHPAVLTRAGEGSIALRHDRSRPRCTIPRPSIPGASRPCDRNDRPMTFRAKPVVKRAHRPAWEAQDRRNFYLNVGFGLIVAAGAAHPGHRDRPVLLQRSPRVGRQRQRPVDQQGRAARPGRDRELAARGVRAPGPDGRRRRAPDRGAGDAAESTITDQQNSSSRRSRSSASSTPSSRRSSRRRKASARRRPTSTPSCRSKPPRPRRATSG